MKVDLTITLRDLIAAALGGVAVYLLVQVLG